MERICVKKWDGDDFAASVEMFQAVWLGLMGRVDCGLTIQGCSWLFIGLPLHGGNVFLRTFIAAMIIIALVENLLIPKSLLDTLNHTDSSTDKCCIWFLQSFQMCLLLLDLVSWQLTVSSALNFTLKPKYLQDYALN